MSDPNRIKRLAEALGLPCKELFEPGNVEGGHLTHSGWVVLIKGVMKAINPHLKELTLSPIGELKVPTFPCQQKKISDLIPDWTTAQEACNWVGLFFLMSASSERADRFEVEHGPGVPCNIIFGLSRGGKMFEVDLLLPVRNQSLDLDSSRIGEPQKVTIKQLVKDYSSPRVFLADILENYGLMVTRRQTLADKAKETQEVLEYLVALADSLR